MENASNISCQCSFILYQPWQREKRCHLSIQTIYQWIRLLLSKSRLIWVSTTIAINNFVCQQVCAFIALSLRRNSKWGHLTKNPQCLAEIDSLRRLRNISKTKIFSLGKKVMVEMFGWKWW